MDYFMEVDEFIRGVSRPINLQLAKIALNLDITDQTESVIKI